MRPIRLFTTPTCGYCVAARRLLDTLGLEYQDTDLTGNPALKAKLAAENNGYRTVPMIFIGDEFVGGYTDLLDLTERDELAGKLRGPE